MLNKSLGDLLVTAEKKAKEINIPIQKVKFLLSEILDIPEPELSLSKHFVIDNTKLDIIISALDRLYRHEPVQYILNKAYFYGLVLEVNPHVLIPRPETEGLVEWVLTEERSSARVIDIGYGSGAIAIALKMNKPKWQIYGIDTSYPIYKTACKNASTYKLDIRFSPYPYFYFFFTKFDIVVSNPPYISEADYTKLDEEIKLYEPPKALIGGKDGLFFYRKILSRAKKMLKKDGVIFLEIGETQAEKIIKIAKNYGFFDITVKKDLAGKDRYIRIRTPRKD